MTGSVVIIRHPRERLSKCSLRHLHDHPSFAFHKAVKGFTFDASGHVELAVDAPPLTVEDRDHPLLILDSTWRLLPKLEACIRGTTQRRSLPRVATAYPRVSRVFTDPSGGLASLEALYLALKILGDDDPSLLDDYHWKDTFLSNVAAAGL